MKWIVYLKFFNDDETDGGITNVNILPYFFETESEAEEYIKTVEIPTLVKELSEDEDAEFIAGIKVYEDQLELWCRYMHWEWFVEPVNKYVKE